MIGSYGLYNCVIGKRQIGLVHLVIVSYVSLLLQNNEDMCH